MNKPKLLIIKDDEGLPSQYCRAFPACHVVIANSRRQTMAALG